MFEAFKTIEIVVRAAGGYDEKQHGRELMARAFAIGGPLVKPATTKVIARL